MSDPSNAEDASDERRQVATTTRRAALLGGGCLATAGIVAAAQQKPSSGALQMNAHPDALHAKAFGARFDDATDDSRALQNAIDRAAATSGILALPPGTARLGSPLDLKQRYVSIVGTGIDRTVLRASAAMATMIDAADASEVQISPFRLESMTLDGANMATVAVTIRYRHHSLMTDLLIANTSIGVMERDCWLSRRVNCRTQGNEVGWHLAGSNHRSQWQGCSFIAARQAHLLIENRGTAGDGNQALLFTNCDIEYGSGAGAVIGSGCAATFDTCYLGEAIDGDVIRNSGNVLVRGGVLYFSHTPASHAVRPLAGRVRVENASVHGQGHASLANLIGLSAAEAASGHGTVSFHDIAAQLPVGGDPAVTGDILAHGPPAITFAPRLGTQWQPISRDAEVAASQAFGLPNARAAACTAVTGPNPAIGLAAPLSGSWRRNEPFYLVLVYSSDAPLLLWLRSREAGLPAIEVGRPPAVAGVTTYMKVDMIAPSADYDVIELLMPARVGQRLTLHEASLADSRMVSRPASVLGNLYKC